MPLCREITLNAERAREVNQLLQAIYYARSEAIKRNGVVSLCPSLDGSTCTTATAWQTGWLVFVNLDHDSPADRDAAEDLLRVYEPWPQGRITSNRTTLSFRAFGQSGVTATIAFCDDRGSAAARAVIISQTGRPRLTDRNSSGGAIACS
jgi:type IV fimbrial biogenesis protein FimT